MKSVGVLGVALPGLFVIGAVTATSIATFDDAVAAFNPTERISGKKIIRVRP